MTVTSKQREIGTGEDSVRITGGKGPYGRTAGYVAGILSGAISEWQPATKSPFNATNVATAAHRFVTCSDRNARIVTPTVTAMTVVYPT